MVTVIGAEQVDVEAAVITHLRGALPAGVTVATQIPRTSTGGLRFPDRMVRVTRAGGPRWSVAHDRPLVLVECWADPSMQAWRLASSCRSALLALDNTLVGGAWLSHVAEASGPVNHPDDRTVMPRYQFVHQLLVKAAHSPQTGG